MNVGESTTPFFLTPSGEASVFHEPSQDASILKLVRSSFPWRSSRRQNEVSQSFPKGRLAARLGCHFVACGVADPFYWNRIPGWLACGTAVQTLSSARINSKGYWFGKSNKDFASART
jgi:hypothetical protein